MKIKFIVAVVLFAVFLVLTFYFFGLLHFPIVTARYKIGDEIRSFPVDELSITVSNLSTVNSVKGMWSLSQDTEYVIIPVKVHNLADHVLYFNRQDDFNDKLNKAMSTHLYLVYGDENHKSSPMSSSFYNWGSLSVGWGINANSPNNPAEITSLAANQSEEGFLCFMMGTYYAPKELICQNGNQQTVFAIDLKS